MNSKENHSAIVHMSFSPLCTAVPGSVRWQGVSDEFWTRLCINLDNSASADLDDTQPKVQTRHLRAYRPSFLFEPRSCNSNRFLQIFQTHAPTGQTPVVTPLNNTRFTKANGLHREALLRLMTKAWSLETQ